MRAVKDMGRGLRGVNHQVRGGQAFTIGGCCALDGLVGLLLCNLAFGLHCHFLDGGWLGLALDCHLGGLHLFWCCPLWTLSSLCLGQGCNKLHGIMKDFARLPHGIVQDFARLPHGIIQDFATLPSIQDSIENWGSSGKLALLLALVKLEVVHLFMGKLSWKWCFSYWEGWACWARWQGWAQGWSPLWPLCP